LSNTHPVIFVGRDIARFLRYKVTYLLPDHQYRIKERAAARIRADVIFGRDSEIDDLKSSLEYGTSIEETAVFLCRSGSGLSVSATSAGTFAPPTSHMWTPACIFMAARNCRVVSGRTV